MSDELKVILIAAAAFVVINIIMWTVIAISNKIEKKRKARSQSKSSERTQTMTREQIARTIELSPSAVAEEYMRTAKKQDMRIIDDIVIVHTDEVIQ